MTFIPRCKEEGKELISCYIYKRAGNLAVVKVDFANDFYVKTNVVNRSSFFTRVSGYGGTIGNSFYYKDDYKKRVI